jgi:two-component system, NarL family, response regulator DevR
MIRCIVADDHPAVRTGLLALLRSEPGFVPVGAAGSAAEARREVELRSPDLALVDYNLPDEDGLTLCCDLKASPKPPSVVLYSAFAGPRLALAAIVAGAEAVLAKGAPVDEMFTLLRAVGRGASTKPDAPPAVVERSVERLDPAEIPIFGMAMAGTPVNEIAAVTGDDIDCVRVRIRALVQRLAPRQTKI